MNLTNATYTPVRPCANSDRQRPRPRPPDVVPLT